MVNAAYSSPLTHAIARRVDALEEETADRLRLDDPAEAHFRDALKARLLRVLEKPLTSGTLHELEQTARLVRDLLTVGRFPDAFSSSSIPGIGGLPLGYGGPFSSSVETFGVTVLKEMIPVVSQILGRKNEPRPLSLGDLNEALAIARDRKNDRLAQKLEARIEALLLPPEDEDAEPPPSPVEVPEVDREHLREPVEASS